MKRGDLVIVSLPGDYGKPRPAVIVETDRMAPTEHVLVCPSTTHILLDVGLRRILVEPDERNGLRERSQLQIDKLTVYRRAKCGAIIGVLDEATIERMNAALALMVGLLD